uniref:Putative secreted protein n=1 Tax=Amblyomma cajennense TaxID=34607 RepID=A0A023FU07_AMBCJ
MFSAADLCAFVGFLFAFVGAHAKTAQYDTDARKVLSPPHVYWLYRKSIDSDTSFTSTHHCVEMEYVYYNGTSDIVTLDLRNHTKREEWSGKMYVASVKSTANGKDDILQFTPFDEDDGTGTFDYQVLHVVQNSCYIVEKMPANGDITERKGKKHNCELWIKKDKEVLHQRPSVNVEGQKACWKELQALCSPRRLVHWPRLCDPIIS